MNEEPQVESVEATDSLPDLQEVGGAVCAKVEGVETEETIAD